MVGDDAGVRFRRRWPLGSEGPDNVEIVNEHIAIAIEFRDGMALLIVVVEVFQSDLVIACGQSELQIVQARLGPIRFDIQDRDARPINGYRQLGGVWSGMLFITRMTAR